MTHSEQPSVPAEARRGPVGRVLVIIPTYNERENLPLILDRVRAAAPEADVLVADDGSPDGTGRDRRRAGRRRRAGPRPAPDGKEGLGAAYIAGFALGLEPATTCWWRWTPTGRTPRAAAPAAGRAAARRRRARLPLGARRHGGRTGRSAASALPRRQPVLPARAGHADPRHHRRLPRLPAEALQALELRRRRLAGLLLPGRPGVAGHPRRASGWPRCRSRSSSGRSASPR